MSTEDEIFAAPSFSSAGYPIVPPHVGGRKAQGLLQLPPDWYPKTLILTADVGSRVCEADEVGSAGSVTDRDMLARALTSLGRDSPKLLVRSSAGGETIRERGAYLSIEANADVDSVLGAASRVWQDAPEAHMSVVVQPLLNTAVRGHLSNEYRVSRESVSWTVEQYAGGLTESHNWRVSASAPAADNPLLCQTVGDLELQLRGVAKRLSETQIRHHLEWVWDGSRLWIVQADPVFPVPGDAPGDAWRPARARRVELEDLSVLLPLDTDSEQLSSSRWGKIRALGAFVSVDLQVPILWALTSAQCIEELAAGRVPVSIKKDLQRLVTAPLVVRSDVAGESSPLMMPKLDSTTDLQRIEEFIMNTSQELIEQGNSADDLCFLFHRFIRARASAWTSAKPGDPYVKLDSMWGLPDGLAWLPHDQAWVNVATGRATRSIAGKTSFLDVSAGSSWAYRESPTEWIWRASLTEEQVRKMAQGARRLADQAGEPVLTMWFVGLLDGADAEFIPWFQALDHSQAAASKKPPESMKRVTIASADDLTRFEAGEFETANVVLRLAPSAELIRDKHFVDSVIKVATEWGVPVEIDGSPLAHPYYLLQKAGIPVSCSYEHADPPISSYNKLVRDDIVEAIQARGERVEWFRASFGEQGDFLRQKLVEEALEVAATRGVGEAAEEMADVLEVLEALREHVGVQPDQLENIRERKRAGRGAFSKGIVLVSDAPGVQAANSVEMLDGLDVPSSVNSTPIARRDGNKLTLSLVPPMGAEGRRASFMIRGQEVQIEYKASAIEVKVASGSEEDAPGQISLF